MKKFFFFKRKFWGIVGLSVLALYITLFFLASSIAKSIVEKNSKDWTGRKFSIEKLWVNILTGSISMKGVTIFENDDKTVFGTIKQINSSVSLSSLIVSRYKFRSLSVDEMSLSVIQYDSTFNFSDVIEKFRDTDTTNRESVYFEMKNISLTNSNIHYTNVERDFKEKLNQVNFSCPKVGQNKGEYTLKIAFKDSDNGIFKAKMDLNTRTRDYVLSLISNDLNLGVLSPYVRDFISFGSFNSLMSNDLHLIGNFDKPEDLSCRGIFSLKNMALSDVNSTRLASCKAFEVEIDSIDFKSQYFSIKKTHVEQPYLFYELNKTGNNFDALMKIESIEGIEGSSKSASNPIVILANAIKRTFQDLVVQNYSFKKLSLSNGEVKYVDKTLPETFDYTMTGLFVSSDAITSQQDKITINFNSTLNKSGNAEGLVTFDPEFNNFDINYIIKDLLVADLNPYSKYYTAHAIQDGKMNYTSTTQIRNGKLTSQNGFKIQNIDVSKKLKVYAPEYDLPLRLAISILKDINGDIKLDIPIRGNLKDPNYKLGKALWNVFKNLIFKIAGSPYKVITKNSGKETGNSK